MKIVSITFSLNARPLSEEKTNKQTKTTNKVSLFEFSFPREGMF